MGVGENCCVGLFSGSLVSSVRRAIPMSKSCGAWDTSKKYISAGFMGKELRGFVCSNAAGNTTAVIGKGFAIGSAALTSVALCGAFCQRAENRERHPEPLEPKSLRCSPPARATSPE